MPISVQCECGKKAHAKDEFWASEQSAFLRRVDRHQCIVSPIPPAAASPCDSVLAIYE